MPPCCRTPAQWRKFTNPARGDGLELEHWVKCYRDAQARGWLRLAAWNSAAAAVLLRCWCFPVCAGAAAAGRCPGCPSCRVAQHRCPPLCLRLLPCCVQGRVTPADAGEYSFAKYNKQARRDPFSELRRV